MKILMTADTIGGVWTYALELARALSDHGFEFALATMGKPLDPAHRSELAAISNVHLFESDFQLEWMDDPWDDVAQAGEWLLQLERQFDPDVIHLNGYVHAALPWSHPVLVACHSCVLSWWSAVKREPAPLEECGVYKKLVSRGLCAADHLVAPSRFMSSAIRENYPIGHKTIEVIANARNAANFRRAEKDPIILCAGRLWDEAKNIAALRDIAPLCSWPIYAAGDALGPIHASEPQDLVANFHPLGPLSPEALANWMSRAAIYCLPARYEPFGLTVLEAALSGCALVLSDIPSFRENWDGAAVFAPLDDHDALLHAISDVTSYPVVRARLAASAYERALTFTPQRLAGAYLLVYHRLATQWNSVATSAPGSTACAS